MAVGCAVIKIYIVCVINKYVLKIPLLICVNGRSKSYVCLQLSLGGDAAWCVLMSDWLLRHSHFSWAVPECSSACAQPRSCSGAEGSWAKLGLHRSRGKQRCLRYPSNALPCVSTAVNGLGQLAVLNIRFINSCYGNWQIFINHLKRSPCPWGLLLLHWNMGWFCWQGSQSLGCSLGVGFDEFSIHSLGILLLHPPCCLSATNNTANLSFSTLPSLETYLPNSKQKAK